MAGRDVVGEAVLLLELDDHASEEMARAVAEFRAEAAALGREKAEIKVKADTDEAQRKLKELLAEEKALAAAEKDLQTKREASQRQQKAALTRQLKDKQAEIAATRQNVDATKEEIAALKRKQQVARDVNKMATQLTREQTKAEKDLASQIKQSEKAEKDRAKVAVDSRKKMEQAARDQARAEGAASRQRAADAKAEEAAASSFANREKARIAQEIRDTEAARTATLRRNKEIERGAALQTQYASAQKRFSELDRAYRRAQGSDKVNVKVDGLRALAEMKRIQEELRLMGLRPITQKLDVQTSAGSKAKSGAMSLLNAFGFTRQDQIKGVASDLGRVARAAKEARVNIGPLSTSLAGLVVGGAALAPVISGVIGTLGSLVSVTGAGVVGALGAGSAAAAGFGLATLGIVGAIKPYITGVLQAHKATMAYNQVVAKYGENSKQATKAHKILENQLSSLPPFSRKAAEGFSKLGQEWHKATGVIAQRSLGNILGSSLQTVKTLLPSFARDTNTALTNVSNGWQKWMGQLRSPGAQQAIHSIFSNFNQSIPSVMRGLGSLGTAFGRVTAAFSGHLPALANGFAKWAQNIANATSNTGRLHAGVARMISAMQSLGHFFQASGRFLLTFFKAGIGPGIGLVNSMTGGLNRLTAAMSTVAGQAKIQAYFQRSIGVTKDLWNAIKPLGSAFLTLAHALQPVSTAALKIIEVMAKVVGLFAGFKPFQWAGGALIALAIVGRVTAALREMGSTGIKAVTGLVKGFAGGSGLGRISGAFKGFLGGFSGAGGGIEAAIVSGGTAAATEMEAGIATGGAAAAAELRAAMALGGVGGAASSVGGAAAGAAGAEGAIAGEGAAAAAATTEIAGAEAAATGFGAALAGLAIPVGIAAGVVGLALAFKALSGDATDAAKAARGVKEAVRGLNTVRQGLASAKGLPDIAAQVSSPATSLPSDRASVNKLQAEYNKLTLAGATDTQKYRDVVAQLNQALTTRNADQKQVTDGLHQEKTAHQQVANSIDRGLRTAYDGLHKSQDAVKNAQKGINEALGQGGRAGIAAANASKNLTEAQNREKKAQDAVNAAIAAQQQAQFRLVTDSLNQQRVFSGNIPIADQYAVSVGRLATQIKQLSSGGAQSRALNLLVKTPDPSQLARLGNQINGLTGKDRKTAINVVANSSNAQQALDRINSTIIKPKVLKLATNVGDTLAKISQINGVKLNAKTVRLLHEGDAATIGKVAQINGLKLPAKLLRLLGDNQDALRKHGQVAGLPNLSRLLTILGNAAGALSAWNAVQSTVHNITASVTLTATQIVTRVFRAQGSATPPPITQIVPKGSKSNPPSVGIKHGHFAHGGTTHETSGLSSQPVLRAKQIRAAQETLHMKPKVVHVGGAFDRPTLLVGEENRREYVIATNPAYRKNNEGYLARAAKEFGYRLEPAATGRAARGHKSGSSLPPVSQQGKLLKHKHGAFLNSAYDLPAADRIGGVGTQDIDDAISRAQQTFDSYHQRMNSHTDRKGHHVNPSSAEKAKDHQNWMLLQQLKGIAGSARNYIQQFQNVETGIETVGHYMDFADNNPSGTASGIDPVTGRLEQNRSWAFWRGEDVKLQNQHVALLQRAADDARKKVGKNPGAVNIGYVKTLEAALGQSIVERQTVEQAIQQVPQTQQVSLDDYVAMLGLTTSLNQSNYAYSLAQGNNVPDIPGTAAREDLDSLQDDRTAALGLMNFYQNVLAKAQSTGNLPLMTSASDAFNSARSTYMGIQDQFDQAAAASGPGQVQLFDTARSNLLTQFGSNAIMRALGGAPDASSAALQILNAQQVPSTMMSATGSAPSGGSTVNVTNHFATSPQDPHTWSQGLSWELSHAI